MNVLSLFDGMSCGMIALERIGATVNKYYASEIDKYATKVSEANYPDIIRLGDVTKWREWDIDWGSIDLVIGGFPCQAWSMAGKQLGDKDERGMLFWTMLDIMKHVRKHNPKAEFLIENVKMKKEFEEYITHHTTEALGTVHKILINSALVSAQNRNRYYWTSFEATQPEDRGIVLADIIEDGFVDRDSSHCLDANYYKGGNLKSYFEKNRRQLVFKCGAIRGRYIVDGKRADHIVDSMAGKTEQRLELRKDEKTNTLTTVQKDNQVVFTEKLQTLLATLYKENAKSMVKRSKTGLLVGSESQDFKQYKDGELYYRKLTPQTECERLQTVPDNYTNHVSNTQRYKMLGNGWTVDVIAHLLK